MGTNSANKFFDALAAGRPIAINYGGWHRHLLDESTAPASRCPRATFRGGGRSARRALVGDDRSAGPLQRRQRGPWRPGSSTAISLAEEFAESAGARGLRCQIERTRRSRRRRRGAATCGAPRERCTPPSPRRSRPARGCRPRTRCDPPDARAPASAASSLVCRVGEHTGRRRACGASAGPAVPRDDAETRHGASSRMGVERAAREGPTSSDVAADDLGRTRRRSGRSVSAQRVAAARILLDAEQPRPRRRRAARPDGPTCRRARRPRIEAPACPARGRAAARCAATRGSSARRRPSLNAAVAAMSTGPSSTIADGTIHVVSGRRTPAALQLGLDPFAGARRGAKRRLGRLVAGIHQGAGHPRRRRNRTRARRSVGIRPAQRGSAAVSSGSAATRSAPLRATRRRIAFTRPAAPGPPAPRERGRRAREGGVRWDAVGVEELVRAQPQRVANGRLQPGPLTAAEHGEHVVERAAALDRAEREPRRERAVAGVELEARRLRGQRGVRPGASLLDAAEHAQRCQPGRHQPARVAGPSGPRRPRSSSPAVIARLPAGWILLRSRAPRRRSRPPAGHPPPQRPARRPTASATGSDAPHHEPLARPAASAAPMCGASARTRRSGVDHRAAPGSSSRSAAVSLWA